MSFTPIPMNQVAFAVLDLRRTEAWWREGLGFLPAGGSRLMFRPPLSDGKIQKLPGAAMTCWCMVGRNDWAQLEFFQYETPISKLMPEDYRACDIGYSRCGVWVADFDAALRQLKALGTEPLTAPVGKKGQRRACVRNPDGVFVELMEDDPLPEQNGRGRLDCPVALRYATLSTPSLKQTSSFLKKGLGMRTSDIVLHDDAHEALWNLPGAQCTRQVFIGGSDTESMLVEVVQYADPVGKPFPKDYRLCDQRILNICFGDPQGFSGVEAMHLQALAAGATETTKPLNLGMVGCVYVDDPLGFSYEFMFAAPMLHKAFGFVPTRTDERPELDDQRIELVETVNASPKKVFAILADHEGLGKVAGLGHVRLARQGDSDPQGRGAERLIPGPTGDIREQITDWWPNRGYRYRIIEGGPFVGYWGEIKLVPAGKGTRIEWTARFRSKVPFTGGLLRRVVEHKLGAALRKVARHIDQQKQQ